MEEISFILNGEEVALEVEKTWTLLYLLREVMDLTGTKCGCETNDCGACRVIIDGVAKNSCCVLAKNIAGKTVETIEGLSKGNELHPIQEAFIESGAIQCGFCTPGMIMSAKALLDENKNPSEDEIRNAIKGNLCRCTGYVKIIDAICLAAKKMGAI